MLKVGSKVRIKTPGEWADGKTGLVYKDKFGVSYDYGVKLDETGDLWGFQERELEALPPEPGQNAKEFPLVSRLEVIDDSGRAFTTYTAKNVQVHLQDDGRTMKIFLRSE